MKDVFNLLSSYCPVQMKDLELLKMYQWVVQRNFSALSRLMFWQRIDSKNSAKHLSNQCVYLELKLQVEEGVK